MPSVRDFYQNENILITGGTGFLGKLLISKLLISCPKIKKIFLLIRKKNNIEVGSRLETLFNDVVFDELSQQVPQFRDKIQLVKGDCEQRELGLSQTDRFEITQHASIVFYCAANVEIANNLKSEVIANVSGAIEIVQLLRNVKNLKAFVYVSSSYSNCHLPVVEEKLYEPNIHYKTLLKLTQTDFLNINERYILGQVGSTYFYSKAAAEQAVQEEGRGLPIAIFRPSAIISTWKEPLKGWTDKAFAPTAVHKSLILGHVSSVLCTENLMFDMVPGDFVVNALIATAWDVHNRFTNKKLHEARVYNYTSMMDNPLKLNDFLEKTFQHVQRNPSEKSIWYPALSLQSTRFANRLASLFRPWLLTFVLQSWYRKSGQKLDLMKNCRSYDIIMGQLDGFIKKPHVYRNENVRELWQDLDEVDQKLFYFDMRILNWDAYLKIYYDGILKYLIRETDADKRRAQKHYLKLKTLHHVVSALLYLAASVLLYFVLRRYLI